MNLWRQRARLQAQPGLEQQGPEQQWWLQPEHCVGTGWPCGQAASTYSNHQYAGGVCTPPGLGM